MTKISKAVNKYRSRTFYIVLLLSIFSFYLGLEHKWDALGWAAVITALGIIWVGKRAVDVFGATLPE